MDNPLSYLFIKPKSNDEEHNKLYESKQLLPDEKGNKISVKSRGTHKFTIINYGEKSKPENLKPAQGREGGEGGEEDHLLENFQKKNLISKNCSSTPASLQRNLHKWRFKNKNLAWLDNLSRNSISEENDEDWKKKEEKKVEIKLEEEKEKEIKEEKKIFSDQPGVLKQSEQGSYRKKSFYNDINKTFLSTINNIHSNQTNSSFSIDGGKVVSDKIISHSNSASSFIVTITNDDEDVGSENKNDDNNNKAFFSLDSVNKEMLNNNVNFFIDNNNNDVNLNHENFKETNEIKKRTDESWNGNSPPLNKSNLSPKMSRPETYYIRNRNNIIRQKQLSMLVSANSDNNFLSPLNPNKSSSLQKPLNKHLLNKHLLNDFERKRHRSFEDEMPYPNNLTELNNLKENVKHEKICNQETYVQKKKSTLVPMNSLNFSKTSLNLYASQVSHFSNSSVKASYYQNFRQQKSKKNRWTDIAKIGRLFGKRKVLRLIQQTGECNIQYSKVDRRSIRFFTDFFTTLLELNWNYNILFYLFCFLFSWIFFALLWLALFKIYGSDEKGINCVENVYDFKTSLLFSIETQQTIGYGTRSITERCGLAYILLMIQSIFGAISQCVVTGTIFAKLARPNKRAATIIFSKNMVVCSQVASPYNFHQETHFEEAREENNDEKMILKKEKMKFEKKDLNLNLEFRVGDIRNTQLIGVRISAILVRKNFCQNGNQVDLKQERLKISTESEDDFYFLAWPIKVIHQIDESSPFWRSTAEDIALSEFEILIVLEANCESSGGTVQVKTSYLPNEIVWGRKLSPLFTRTKYNGKYTVDYSRFNETIPDEEMLGKEGEARGCELIDLQSKEEKIKDKDKKENKKKSDACIIDIE